MIHDVKLPLRTLLFVFCYALFHAFFFFFVLAILCPWTVFNAWMVRGGIWSGLQTLARIRLLKGWHECVREALTWKLETRTCVMFLINTGLKSTWPEHIIAAVGHHWKYIHIAFATRLSFYAPLQYRGSLESSLWHVDIQPTSSIASKCSISTSRCSPEMPSLTPSFLPHTHCIVP